MSPGGGRIEYMKVPRSIFLSLLYGITLSVVPIATFASSTDGTIDVVNRYAWNENSGWLDFGDTNGNVHVTDSALTGYVWGENVGWVSLNCSNDSSCGTVNYKVANDGSGNLSGHGWGENVGWIDFAPTGGGVSISASGVFSGYAWSENLGWINFTITNPVTTDWRPASARQSATPASAPARYGSIYTSSASSLPNVPKPRNQISVRPNTIPSRTPAPTFLWNRQLWDRGADILALQKFLNENGFTVASSGAGSAGNETSLFGTLTLRALKKFQTANNLPATGYFGPATRKIINNKSI